MRDRVGKEVRKVCYIGGKKHYAVWQLVRYESYKRSSQLDQKYKSKAERKG